VKGKHFMGDRVIFSVFIFIIVVLWMGVMTIIKPEFAFRTTATNTLKKKTYKSSNKKL
jgi:NADH:ubiquinone oxidoreductase subunit 3 (subunit A)